MIIKKQLLICSSAHPKAGWHPAELPRRKMKGTGKARDVDVRNANEMRTVEEAKRRLINQ
ncbi:MAG: hypothetical protein IJ900_00930 [Paludibacteraceae bacterium]|nr:hypothetical protein [Paludibacteraceae bacterium]